MGTRAWTGRVLLGLGLLLLAIPAQAVITAELPLATLIGDANFIVLSQIDSLDATRLQMVLTVQETIKGKATVTRCPVVLKGDTEAIKSKQTPDLLKRLAPKMPVILFVMQRDDEYRAFAFSNGTWFQLEGTRPEGEANVRWSFAHLEPYLRRTYKGSTSDLKSLIVDVVAGKRKAPGVDAREKPGLGPEAEAPRKDSRLLLPLPLRYLASLGMVPVLGVIALPTLIGPLALLAMLFPSVFGGYKRWLAFISVVCTTSTVYFLYDWWLAPYLTGTIWASPLALWLLLTAVTFWGCVWAWRRHTALVETGQNLPSRGIVEPILLAILTLVGAGFIIYGWKTGARLTETPWMLVATTAIAAAVTLLRALYLRLRPRADVGIPGEAILLTGMTLASLVLGVTQAGPSRAIGQTEGEVATAEDLSIRPGKRIWKHSWPIRGTLAAAPLVVADRVYVSLADQGAWRQGQVSCLDASTGEEIWNTARTLKKMKMISISSPFLGEGSLFVGEGYHEDQFCHLYCLNARDGSLQWKFQTRSHVESSPSVVDGKVYFGAGDDGLHCVNAKTGEAIWHYPGLHIDASPLIAGGRVYACSGVGDEIKQPAIVCVDAEKGTRIWQHDIKEPAWGSPTLAGDLVLVGFGEGRVGEVLQKMIDGGVLAVNARSGEEVWRFKTDQPVLGRPAVDRRYVYFGCRNDMVYCLERGTGKPIWSRSLGGPLSASIGLARSADTGETTSLFAAVENGLLYCLNPLSGKVYWQEDLGTDNVPVQLIASPTVIATAAPGGQVRRIYLGANVNPSTPSPQLHCIEDQINALAEVASASNP